MSHYLQIALEISLVPWITYFTPVSLQITNLFELFIFIPLLIDQFFIKLFNVLVAADSLTVESLLELLDEESLRKDTALPSPEWSSDHIALLAEFRCKPRIRR